MLTDDSQDDVHVLFIRAVIRTGRERGWEVIESLRNDPLLGQAATIKLNARDARLRKKQRQQQDNN
jgi:hypothetical protein